MEANGSGFIAINGGKHIHEFHYKLTIHFSIFHTRLRTHPHLLAIGSNHTGALNAFRSGRERCAESKFVGRKHNATKAGDVRLFIRFAVIREGKS